MTDITPPDAARPDILIRADGATIAYHKTPGKSPGVIFLPGFMSDMGGTKACALEAACRATGRACLRFDFFGHGQSSGAFREATVGRWREDAVAVIDALAEGRQVLVGSSMGGWIMLLAALDRPERIAGLVGIAPAPDFVEDLMWAQFSDEIKATLARDGVYYEPSQYSDEPYAITRKLVEEGRNHLLLGDTVPLDCPVRILQGMADPDVPWRHALKLVDALRSDDVELVLVKNGDHRLSADVDIARLCATVETLCASLEAG